MVLVLFDSPAGHCLFKVTDASMLKKPDTIWDMFTSPDNAKKACAAATTSCTLPDRACTGARDAHSRLPTLTGSS